MTFFNKNKKDENTSLKTAPVNIKETNNDYKVELSAPGREGEDFKLDIDDSTMTIRCEKIKKSKEEAGYYKHREFACTNFSRSFELPENTLPDKINAWYENGILKIILPKKNANVTSIPNKIIRLI